MTRVCVALSGGADSFAALLRLRDECEVAAIHATFFDSPGEPALVSSLSSICSGLKIPFFAYDLREIFQEAVVAPFVMAWRDCLSPNPCVTCNRRLKFGALMERAFELGADFFATGHYAAKTPNPYCAGAPFLLAPAKDARKNQSYFLALIKPDKLPRIIFPLANSSKMENRALLREAGINPPAGKESVDVCFIPDGDKNRFLNEYCRARALSANRPGDILTRDKTGSLKREGTHFGLWNYTEGQRRGLGVAHTAPLYVIARDGRKNALIVGERSLALINSIRVAYVNYWVSPPAWPNILLAKTRSVGAPAPVKVRTTASGLEINFLAPQLPAGAGQLAVVMDEQQRVLAAGIITR